MENSKTNREQLLELNKTFEKIKPRLRNYIKKRLDAGLKKGIIQKGFYKVEDIIDSVYLMSYEALQQNKGNFNPKTVIFKNAIEKMNEILKSEKLFSNKIAINKLLKAELDMLKEDFTAEADGDLVLDEELSDISYHLKDNDEKILLLDNNTSKQIEKDLDESAVVSKTIYELASFGDLTVEEISEILDAEIGDVRFIYNKIK